MKITVEPIFFPKNFHIAQKPSSGTMIPFFPDGAKTLSTRGKEVASGFKTIRETVKAYINKNGDLPYCGIIKRKAFGTRKTHIQIYCPPTGDYLEVQVIDPFTKSETLSGICLPNGKSAMLKDCKSKTNYFMV